MAHLAKFSRGALGHMLGHYSREKKHLPDNIKPELTHLNYNLAANYQPQSQIDFIRQRLSKVKVQNRADVNVLCDWIVTAPKSLPREELRLFFKSTHDFLANKYGKENVVSAYVHMDEATPHLHFAFIPVVPDKKKGGYKVSAKECITLQQLKSFHSELQNYLENELGHPVEVLNEATRVGNKSVLELKRHTAIVEVQKARQKASRIVSQAQKQVEDIHNSLMAINAEYEAKKAYIQRADETARISEMYPPEVKVFEKGLIHKQRFVTVPVEMWEAKHVSANEKEYLKKANEAFEYRVREFRGSVSSKRVNALTQRVEELEREVNHSKLMTEKLMDKVNRVLDKLPANAARQFIDEWNALDKHPKRESKYPSPEVER